MKPFRRLTIAVFAAVTVPRLAHEGMFVDGVTYASLARNLADGRGSFWAPSYTATIYPEFHDHPPLGFWLQSLWFRVLGDHLFVERAYSIAAACVTALLIAVLWRRMTRGSDAGPYDWLPILFWLAMPVVSWAIVGNLLETTVSVFTTAAVVAVVYAGLSTNPTLAAIGGAVSGLCVVAAVLTKGPIGLFPLVAPIILFSRAATRRNTLACLLSQWSIVAICALVVLASDTARSSLSRYVTQQVVAALAGRREVSHSSLTILRELLQGMLIPVVVISGSIVALARGFVSPVTDERAWGTSSLLLALSGSLPILVSTKQAGHYLVPALPFYALAAANLTVRTAEVAGRRLAAVAVNSLSAVLLAATVVAAFSPGVGRDRRRMAEIDVLAQTIPRGATIGICPESNGDWGLHAWFQRRFLVSLDAADGRRRDWFLTTAAAGTACVPPSCQPTTDPSRELVLLKCSLADRR